MWESLEAEPVLDPVPDPQPSGISRRLKPFQLEGVNWMRRQEQTHWKGGLLGDEMGMGKTIQAVSLLMSDYPVGKPSLVVVPPVALMQWSSEIESYTDGKLKVLVYHNSNPKVKQLKLRDLKAYDVIMISYSGLESMHRKEVKGWRRGAGMVKEDSKQTRPGRWPPKCPMANFSQALSIPLTSTVSSSMKLTTSRLVYPQISPESLPCRC
jgi:DNA repair protein RAD16